VTTAVRERNGQLYIQSLQIRMDREFPHDKFWTANVARDPRVRLKIGDKIYEMTAVLVPDRAEVQSVIGRNPETRAKGSDGEERVTSLVHLYRLYQRNVGEF
jgi:hypothetical protein